MSLSEHKRAVGTFSSRKNIEDALRELKDAGFDMNKASVIARNNDADVDNQVAGIETNEQIGNTTDEVATTGAVTGGVFGGITGLLVGLGSLAIPGVGPILLAGEIATTLITTVAGASIGAAAGGLLGALVSLGIPEERAKIYNQRIERGDYLLILDGSEASISSAEVIVKNHGIEEFEIYNVPNSSANEIEQNPQPIADKDSKVVIIDHRESGF
ncbi:MAG: signal transduction histidine kinase LytS [Rivularia sp. (in: Bacteria)]|nr:signal transduction histidine kinase LytS [Rivularia sp. MS3]